MWRKFTVLLSVLILPIVLADSNSDETDLATAERTFNEDLGVVLSDLSAEIAAKNRTFIAEKLAQIRNRKKKVSEANKVRADDRPRSDLKSGRIEKRLKRRKLKQKCLELANPGMKKLIKKKMWKRMFRCFWNWLTSPIGMGLGQNPARPNRTQRRRKKQKQRLTMAEDKRKEKDLQMSRQDIERNKEILKETFKRLNGFYRAKAAEDGLGSN